MGAYPTKTQDRNDLGFPPELSEKIGCYLTVQDRLVSRTVCRSWNEFIVNSLVKPEVTVVIQHQQHQLQELASSELTGKWTSFLFKNVESIRNCPSFWDSFSYLITELKFYECQNLFAHSSPVPEATKLCPKLRYLSLNKCDISLMLGSEKFSLSEWLCLENLEYLDMSENPRYLSDRILFSLLLKTKKLRSLNLSETGMIFNNAVFNRYYPGWNEKFSLTDYSENVLTFQALRDGFLASAHVCELVMDRSNITGDCLESISNPDMYRWEKISLNLCREVKIESLRKFLVNQKLKSLRIDECIYSTESLEQCLQQIPGDIESLYLRRSNIKTLKTIQHLQNLKELDIDNTLVTFCPSDGEALTRLKKLKLLHIARLTELEASPVIELATRSQCLEAALGSLKNLTILNLATMSKSVTNKTVQIIIKNMRCLQILNLTNNILITDLGLDGQLFDETDEEFKSKNFVLNRRADYTAWKNAGSVFGVSLNTLTSLKELRLTNCGLLSDASWESGLNLPYLEKLNISLTSITKKGLIKILKNCRSLISIKAFQFPERRRYFQDDEIKQHLLNHPRLKTKFEEMFGDFDQPAIQLL